MPNKITTETQIARLLGATPIPVELTLCIPDTYRSKTTPADHMASFYRPWSQLRDEAFDGVIVTGAPVETLRFEEVAYWPDLCAIFDSTSARGLAGFYICWAAQAALFHYHGVPKHRLPQKLFGVFQHRLTHTGSRLLRGFGEAFPTPVSRHTEVLAADLPAEAGLTVLADSRETGLCLIKDRSHRAVYMFNHLEYDAESLRDEFLRDRQAGKLVDLPRNYFPDDDSQRVPANLWRPYGHLLFGNWLAELQRAAWPPVSDESVIEWALVAPRMVSSNAESRRPVDLR
jgi:homoserine O-succinyltransferase